MGVRIHFSDLPGLSDALLTALESQADPFLAPHVLVPNRNLRRWLQIQIAARHGIAANINFEYLEQGLVGILRTIVPHVQLADPASIQWSLLRALGSTNEASDSIDRFRKASRYSYLFRDYEYHRNRTIRQWQAEIESTLAPTSNLDIFDFDERVSESEGHSWQKSLYQEMLSILHGRRMHTLTELGCAALEEEHAVGGTDLHIFGLSRMSRLHISILFRLAVQRDVHIYLFDVFGHSLPSANSDGEIHPGLKATTERDFIHIESKIPEAEYSFQKDGLELVFLFQQGTEFLRNHGAESRWFRHRSPGQGGILNRLNADGPAVELVEAPGIRREIESIADHIQMQLARDPTLQPEQIGILVPTMHRYRSHFEYVFRSRNKIPFNLTDFSARETSRLGEALRAMLRFDQPLDRRTVFQLLSNRAVRTKWKIQEEDFRRILEVCDQLNLFRGIEDSAFPVHGWEHGLRRLRLGSIMAVQEPFLGYLPVDGALADADLLSLFGQFLDTLEGYRGRLRSGEEPFAVIRQMVDALVNMQELKGETAIYMALLESLESGQRAAEISPIDAVAAREWIMDSLNEVAGGIGEYLIQGVTISALQPMRPIPFRRLYIAGLKEGDFPGFPVMHPEDLRADFRLPGDSSLPDGNRFLFLEALASCSEKIVLSYVRWDLSRDDEYQPSSAILDLGEFIDLKERTSVPVHWISNRYREKGEKEYNDFERVIDPVHRRILDQRWGAVAPVGLMPEDCTMPGLSHRRQFFPHQLRRAVEDSLRAYLEFRVGAYPLLEEDLSDVSDEPFGLADGYRSSLQYLLRDAFAHYLGDPSAFSDFISRIYDRAILEGGAPAFYFAEQDRFRIGMENLRSCLIDPALVSLKSKDQTWLATSRPDYYEFLPSLLLKPPARKGEQTLHYSIPCYSESLRSMVYVKSGNISDQLRSIAINALIFASSEHRALDHTVHIIDWKSGKLESRRLQLSTATIDDLLTALLREATILGPLMLPEDATLDEGSLEALLLDRWQELQESQHPVLAMVMEKLGPEDLIALMYSGQEDTGDPVSLEERLELYRRLEDLWS